MSVAHDEQGWKPEVCFTWQIMISIRQINTFHAILVLRPSLRSSISTDLSVDLLQQGLIDKDWQPPLPKGETPTPAQFEALSKAHRIVYHPVVEKLVKGHHE